MGEKNESRKEKMEINRVAGLMDNRSRGTQIEGEVEEELWTAITDGCVPEDREAEILLEQS